VAGDPGGIGYFGFSFFNENQDQLKALEIENEQGDCVPPSAETTQDGSYNPLGRQLFIYPSAEALQRPEVQAFVQFYLDNLSAVIEQAGFIPLTDQQLQQSQQNVEQLLSGSGSEQGGSGQAG
jgi:phosphate transport system substrate-binding protein